MRPVAAALLLLAMAGGAFAEPGKETGTEAAWHPCDGDGNGGGWQVAGADAAERALVCRGVAAAAEVLGGCGVAVEAASRVRLVDALPVFCDSAAYGVFDGAAGEIRLDRPALCVESAPADGFFRLLPLADAFVALAAHETAHALLFAGGLGGERQLEHEYIAGVVQFAAVPEAARAPLLAALATRPPETLAEFNVVLLGFAPDRYAAKAWLHFEAQADGCAFLRALATGAARLPDLPEL